MPSFSFSINYWPVGPRPNLFNFLFFLSYYTRSESIFCLERKYKVKYFCLDLGLFIPAAKTLIILHIGLGQPRPIRIVKEGSDLISAKSYVRPFLGQPS